MLDPFERRILRELQRDASQTTAQIAEKVGLSPSPCLRRVKLLEEAGIIDRYVAVLNQEKLGYPDIAIVEGDV